MSTPPIRFGIMVGAGRLVAHGTVSGEFHIFKLLTFSRVGMLGGMNSTPHPIYVIQPDGIPSTSAGALPR